MAHHLNIISLLVREHFLQAFSSEILFLFTLECKSGTYGLNCTVKCGHCKENTGCYQISGACEEGCKDGWLSPNCTQCHPGRHGSLCTEKCGNCFGNTSCDVLSGVCLQGCEYGYTGQHCKQSNHLNHHHSF